MNKKNQFDHNILILVRIKDQFNNQTHTDTCNRQAGLGAWWEMPISWLYQYFETLFCYSTDSVSPGNCQTEGDLSIGMLGEYV